MVYCDLTTSLVGINHLFICTVADRDIANLVLEDTYERIYHGNTFAQDWRGLFLIRGENVVLLGEIVRFTLSLEVLRLIVSSVGP
jgi:hypothetical protein